MSLFSAGELMTLESYAIFSLIYMGNAEEYVIDLATYLQSLVNYLPSQMEDYCNACEENYETCQMQLYGQYGKQNNYQQQNYYANENGYNGNQANNVNYNYGGRKLSNIERVFQGNQEVRQLDCKICEEYNCVAGDDDNKQEEEGNGYETAAEWLEEISGCKETGIAYQGGYGQNQGGQYYQQQQNDEAAELFAGMICNGDGTGVEIGMLMDDECKLYLPNEVYSNYMSYYDQTYQEMTKDVIEFTFSDTVLSCGATEVVYTTQDLSNYNAYANGNYNWNEGNDEVAEWCEGLDMGENYPVDMNTCGNGYNNYGSYSNNYQYSHDDDDAVSKMSYYEWYRFEIGEYDSIDMSVVCEVAKANGFHTFYNTANGSLYSYKGASDAVEDFLDATYGSKKGMSGAGKFGLVVLFDLVAGAGVALYLKLKEPADDKNVGLIDPEEVETKGGEVA